MLAKAAAEFHSSLMTDTPLHQSWPVQTSKVLIKYWKADGGPPFRMYTRESNGCWHARHVMLTCVQPPCVDCLVSTYVRVFGRPKWLCGGNCTGIHCETKNNGSTFEVVHHHFVHRLNLSMPNVTAMLPNIRPTSCFDQLCWETLTHGDALM